MSPRLRFSLSFSFGCPFESLRALSLSQGGYGCAARWLRASMARHSLAETAQWCSVSLFITILFLFPGTTSANELPPLIPLEDFFRNPEKTSFQLSPGGEYVAYLAP